MVWFCGSGTLAQTVAGTITDAAGEPLPFATVTLKEDRSAGTTASLEGRYSIDLGGRGGVLEFRYIGYEVAVREVAPGAAARTVDVTLTPATYELEVASVSAAAEDPAYRIMREAAARRKEYLRADQRYEVEVYVKGQVKVEKAPERIMGRDIGDMGGLLDSSRAGIVYLSETYSTVQFEQPDRFKETVTASTVSGDPRGYSFNTATSLSFDLYQERADWGKPVASPLVSHAAGVYRFALEGARRGDDGRLVYRIRVAPRSTAVPAYAGVVYVEDESYHLVDADLYLLGATVNAPGLDTLKLIQRFRRRGGAGWETYQRRAEPIIELLGFRFRGIFAAVYGTYDYTPAWPRSPFGAIVSEVLPEANAVDSTRFAERPIPLTPAEQRDYVRKDSIRRAVDSPLHKDSLEQRGNRPGIENLGGYTHTDWRKHSRYHIASPLTDLGFHSVTGVRLATGFEYEKRSDAAGTRELRTEARLGYGFADEEWYPTAAVAYRFDPVYRQTLRLSGGRELADYHRLRPVSGITNTVYSLLAKRNELKLYERRFAEVTHATALRGARAAPWARLSHALAYEWRGFRQNESTYSLRRRERSYETNAPLYTARGGDPTFAIEAPTTLLRYSGTVTFSPGQTYLLRPDALVPTGTAWAEVSVDWRYGVSVARGEPSAERYQFLYVGLSAKRSAVALGRFGKLGARASVGRNFVRDSRPNVIDAQHFGGSELPVAIYVDYLDRYLAADYFTFSTATTWVDGVVEHDFDGWLWQRLPLLRKLGWSVVTRAAMIYLPEEGRRHGELGVGLDKVGFGPARPLRVDVLWARNQVGSLREGATWKGAILRVGVRVPEGLL